MRTFGEIFGISYRVQTNSTLVAKAATKYGLKSTINSKTLVGIEIELENCRVRMPETTKDLEVGEFFGTLWNATEDGSLRNNGREFVTKTGITGADAPIALQLLDPYLKAFYPKATPNFRTGLHIHLNCLDFNFEQVGNLLLLYSLFEQNLFEQSGKRGNSKYSVPLREAHTTFPAILYWMAENLEQWKKKETRIWEKLWTLLRGGTKYCALNYNSLVNHGTVEFRHHKGTRDVGEIEAWLKVLLAMHDYARQSDFGQLLKRVRNLNTVSDYIQLRDEVFPQDVRGFFTVGDHSFKRDMALGSSFVKECLINRAELPDLEVPADNDPFGEHQPLEGRVFDAPREARGVPGRGEVRRGVRDEPVPIDFNERQQARWMEVLAENRGKPFMEPPREGFFGDGLDVRTIGLRSPQSLWFSHYQQPEEDMRQDSMGAVDAPEALVGNYNQIWLRRWQEGDRAGAGRRAPDTQPDVIAALNNIELWLYFKREGMLQA